MTKEFVPYEQAITLKELGFDEPCFGCYFHNNKNVVEYNPNGVLFNHNNKKTRISAPTFSQAFRWLRERFNLDSHIQTYCLNRPKEYHWIIVFNDQAKGHGVAKIYEEAEQACLVKLIELIKNK